MLQRKNIEELVRRIANRAGVDIRRYKPERSEAGRLASMLNHHGVKTVLDVGANEGQFARSLRIAGYDNTIVSFEPLSDAYSKLLAISKTDGSWTIAPRCAIGDRDGEMEIHIAGNSVSSSLLDMHDNHLAVAHDSRYLGTEIIGITTLDSACSSLPTLERPFFLKIDTQGYEDKVLDGAQNVLRQTSGLQMEMSFVTLYHQQQLFDRLLDRVRSDGFEIWAIWPGVCDPNTGRMFQVDVVLFRN